MLRPTEHTDAYQDDTTTAPPLIFLAGPIKHWWTCWDSPEHKAYLEHRTLVRRVLIHAGYLTYAAWDAIKGTWNPKAQAINDVGISVADLLVVMTPLGVPADGTESETAYADRVQTPVLYWRPYLPVGAMLHQVNLVVGPGQRWD